MKKLVYVLVLFVVFIFGMGFIFSNPQPVVLKYKYLLGFEKEMPLAILMLISLVVGVFVGYFASLLKSLKLRRNLAKAKRALKDLEDGQIVG